MAKAKTSPKSKRDIAASEQRQEEVVRLYLTGGTLRSVARDMGISVMTVIRDMDRARAEWKKETSKTYDQLLPEKLAELNAIRAAAWEGWKRSLRDERSRTQKSGSRDGVPHHETRSHRKGQSGNPVFLARLEGCLRLECQLRGLLDQDDRDTSGSVSEVVEVVIESREQHEEFKTLSMEQFRERMGKTG